MTNTTYCTCNNSTISLPNDFARKIFSECIYDSTDAISFFVGLSSILFWLFAQTPQFVLNCRLQRAHGLSFCFLLEWLVADTLNLIGAILTGQIGTTISLAFLFVGMDLALAIQYIILEGTCCFHQNENEDEDDDEDDDEDCTLLNVNNDIEKYTEQYNEKNRNTNQNKSKKHKMLYSIFIPFLALSLFGSVAVPLNLERLLLQQQQQPPRRRSLLQYTSPTDCNKQSSPSYFGSILAWVACVIYLTSRLPQIHKNYTLKSTQGLSLALFTCAVFGNLTYVLSIFIKGDRLINALPFLIGTIGVLCCDMTILCQFFQYKKKR